ncbi:ABC transporter permease [Oceanobacillus kimchii]|uniref:ABC transporter permease n=1 Tax=Oceanobacillus kimchii TaxID=746691 RepID=UPI0021A76827|nr:ABC transporter permease [Oceanobacillus kimchii]MCT1579230.1 ABC transporter permease [Oceanobacillus kimchii]MCT2134638.1 ABC transporter permease [Oceanobacillus kimchii]
MKNTTLVIKEIISNFYLIKRLSIYELKSNNKNNYLGMAWEILNPVIQILIYGFVFGLLLQRSDTTMGGEPVPFFSWLLGAFFVWTFFYQSTIQGSKSIYSRLRMLSKMNFPMSIIPSYVIFSQLYVHLIMIGISVVIYQFMGYYINIYYLQLIYFVFATICLIVAISLITSTISTIVRDFHMLLNSTLRMFLYLSGVLWPLSKLSEVPWLMDIMKLNPLYYIVEGYRAAYFGTEWYFITNWEYTIYFWIVVLLILFIGSRMHMKFRRHFIDFL